MNHRFKKINYEYDLISGNVKRVSYQKGKKDQWSHRYRYDADNRITEVETSADGVHWQRDARYFYYPHGPLERTELGAHVVQGTDYAYTLQGWLKGINGDRLDQRTDMGRDGDPSLSQNANLNVGRDAYALSLGYYGDADYKGIGTAWDDDQPASIAQRPFAPIGMPGIGSTLATEHKPLYNGNIAHTVNSLQPFGLWGPNGQGQVLAQVYAYDQLNRLKKARGVIGLDEYNTWEVVDDDAATNRYRSDYEYDANGNIHSAERYDGAENHYDAFSYKYERHAQRLKRNRLYQLYDDADAGNAYVNEPTGAKDISYTPTITDLNDPAYFDEENVDINYDYNYGYDALGNLVRDDREHIEAIEWTVAGKVKAVDHATGEGPDLAFGYGASGQRIMKQVGVPGTDAGAYREHYIRDAQGNIMATYRYTNPGSISFQLTERPIYGSSRLGSYAKTMQLYNAQAITSNPPPSNIIQRPHLRYELTDHLGNVAAVVTGRLLPSQSLAPFEADLVSAQGYEPFGSLLPGRNYSSSNYRFGLNGQEKDDEIYGATGTSYTADYWQYDPRTARRWNVDPIDKPWESPYLTFAGNPVLMVDPNGANASSDVTKNKDGTFTVVDACDDGDNNIYVVDQNGSRTGEIVGQTLTPFDFMATDDETGDMYFDPQRSGVKFDLKNMNITAPKQKWVSSIMYPVENMSGDQLLEYTTTRFDLLDRSVTSLGSLVSLRDLSGTGKLLDIKRSLGLPEYTPLVLSTDEGVRLTTLRALGNIAFGQNMRSSKSWFVSEQDWYDFVMPYVGAYNQQQNNGNGYNAGAPFYGEHTYSGSFIHYGYFGRLP